MKGNHQITIRKDGVVVCRVGTKYLSADLAKGGFASTYIFDKYIYFSEEVSGVGLIVFCIDMDADIWFTAKISDIETISNNLTINNPIDKMVVCI